jgi:hypothetical protein
LVKDTKTGKPKMSCRNWECGVVIPVVTTCKDAELDREKQEALEAIFGSTVPIPMKAPGRPYRPDEEPWYYAAKH